MLKIIGTDLVISKGFDDKPALQYSEDGKAVRFRVGKRVYDKQATDNHRWINLSVKAFGDLCERIRKMKLDTGSFIHLEGRYDEDVWDDNGNTKRMPVIILSEIEYAYTGNGNKQNGGGETPASTRGTSGTAQPQPETPDGFTGFEPFDGTNPFFPG